MSPTAWLAIAGLLVTTAGGLIAIWVFFRPGIKRATATFDAILGTEPVTDRRGGVIREGQTGLVARTTTLEEAVATLVNQDARIAAVEAAVAAHENRIRAQEVAAEERIAIRQESAAVFRAVADREVVDADTEEP